MDQIDEIFENQDRLKKIRNNIEHTNEEAVQAFFTFLAELEEAGRMFKLDLYLVI